MAAPGLGSRSRSVGRRPFADTMVGVTSRTGCKACSRGAQTKTGSSQTMKTYLIDREEAVAYLARENPAQEHAPLAGHQKSRTPAAAPLQEQNRTGLQPIRNRSWVMRAGSALWAALAVAVSLFASPLRAQLVYVTNEGDSTVSGY